MNSSNFTFVKVCALIAPLAISPDVVLAQAVLLTPGTTLTYSFTSLTPVWFYDPPCGPAPWYFGTLSLPSPYTEPFALRVELFESSSSVSPFWTVDHDFTANALYPPRSTTSFSGTQGGLDWADHGGALRLTYLRGPPIELTYLSMGVWGDSGPGGLPGCAEYQWVTPVPEPKWIHLMPFGTVLVWLFGARVRWKIG